MPNRFTAFASDSDSDGGAEFKVVRRERGGRGGRGGQWGQPGQKGRGGEDRRANPFLGGDGGGRPPRSDRGQRGGRGRGERGGRRRGERDGRGDRDNRDMGRYCKVCHDAGRPRRVYTSHYARETRDPTSEAVCPILKRACCEFCSMYGHFTRDCPSFDPADATFGIDADVGKKPPEPVIAEESSFDRYVRELAAKQVDRVFLRMVPSVGLIEMEEDMRRRRGVAWVDLLEGMH
jgi:hypothetical protein